VNSIEFESWLIDPRRRPLLMGVLNATPDSFSDGGQFSSPAAAVDAALAMIDAGADWIDIGGESTRPGSSPVSADEQLRRTLPIISGLRQKVSTLISIDTTEGRVAEQAIDCGANIVNDISGGRGDKNMLKIVAEHGSAIVLMHMLGNPSNMQANPAYVDVTREVGQFLLERRGMAETAGIAGHRILFDPGLGFGKTIDHNLKLLHDAAKLAALGRPLVMGPSRKSFIGKITGETDPALRQFGTAATIAWCIANQTAVVRIHDVRPMAQVTRMIRAILEAK
jgi:dihydropteroate synthase